MFMASLLLLILFIAVLGLSVAGILTKEKVFIVSAIFAVMVIVGILWSLRSMP